MSDSSKESKHHDHKEEDCKKDRCRCICKSKFNIRVQNVPVESRVNDPSGIVDLGTLSLKGAICPKCEEDESSFTIKFRENNPEPTVESFVFKTCNVVETLCRTVGDSQVQSVTASGIFDPKEGPKRRASISLIFNEVTNTFDFQIVDAKTGQLLALTFAPTQIPEGQLTIKKCDK